MRHFRTFAICFLALASAGLMPAQAQEHEHCLTKEEQREAVASGRAVSLGAAMRAAHARKGEVVKARLCHGPHGLVYLLTLLRRDGKVTRVTVDAGTGKLAEGH
jgi:uncharacterized membrane protein YkoI